MVTGRAATVRRLARSAMRELARLPWRAVQAIPMLPQQRVQALLGPSPLGPEGVWSALDPHTAYAQRPSPRLMEVALGATREAADTRLDSLVQRAANIGSPYAAWANTFPGEHYRLLAGLTRLLAPTLIVEIGTYMGASALAFLEHAGGRSRVVTYDIIPWDQIPGSLLGPRDFEDGRLEQRIGDLAEPTYWATQRQLLLQADVIFLDGPKDGVFESLMLERLAALNRPDGFLLVVDDIRFLEMLEPWSRFPSPKLDLTSFGHWSGTGLALVGGETSSPKLESGRHQHR